MAEGVYYTLKGGVKKTSGGSRLTMDKKSNIGVWKLRNFSTKISKRKVIEHIISNYNNLQKSSEGLPKYRLSEIKDIKSTQGGLKVALYHRRRPQEGLYGFIQEGLIETLPSSQASFIKNRLTYETVDTLLFVYNEQSIYVITSAAGHFIIKDEVDDNFPMEIASRIMSGSFQSSGSRAITGPVYAETKMYRKAYSMSESEAFGRVWKSLRGGLILDDEIIKIAPSLEQSLGINKDMQADIKMSFTLRKTLSYSQLLQLIGELDMVSKLPLTEDRRRAFAFLETTKPVKSPRRVEELDRRLMRTILKDAKAGKTSQSLEICHPDSPELYLNGFYYWYQILGDLCKYGAKVNKPLPTYENLIRDMHESSKYAAHDIDKFINSFKRLKIACYYDEDEEPLTTTLFRCIHGEIEFEGITYFRIDAQWYEAPQAFLEKLKEYFKDDINNGLITNSVPFGSYPVKLKLSKGKRDDREGRFNSIQGVEQDFYYGDKVFAKYGKAEIELFDLLFVTKEKLYIIQSKEGFAGCMRDAASQITMSARAIEEDRQNKTILREYYKEWVTKQSKDHKLSEEEFIGLFYGGRERVYVIACAHKYEFTEDNLLDENKFYSHIARFETHQTVKEFKSEGYQLKLSQIPII